MTKYQPLPIPTAALDELRLLDDSGRPLHPYTAGDDGDPNDSVGSPLRCCLRPAGAGERIALVSYAPLRRWAAGTGADPGAYDEAGPVFIHADACPGPADDRTGYPFTRAGALRTVRRYDERGRIVGGRLLEIPQDAETGFDTALAEAFAAPEVALVQVRAVEYGCLHFMVLRP